ncbi:TonB-dependent receptor [Rudaea sp.]|uniref:TonB-dependent receptor n=1 Tax=Rudaea sp. TaxID=2136325 RepID=UPI002F925DDF
MNMKLLPLVLSSILAMSSVVYAQDTTSGVSGRVTSANGSPVAGAKVRIVHVPSGTASNAVTDANGRYQAQGLRVGGPYHIEAQGNGIKEVDVDNVYIELGQVATANLVEGAAAATQLEGIIVSASTLNSTFNSDNKGLGTYVSGRALETAVSGNRSLDDIARLDPRITVTDQNDGSISLAGQNNRFNEISVDGLSVRDPFGLNSNGLGFSGSPISPDTIAAYEIKATDYDAAFDSVGANINAVTKSGTNEFHGSVYGAYTDASSMVGSRGGADYSGFDKNKTWGATFGGPIIKDKLFFFAAYEDQKITGIKGVGTDAVSSIGGLSQAQVDAVAHAFTSIGIDPGTNGSGGSGLTLEDKRSLAKLDWNITDSQRASFTYQRTEESKPTPYSGYVLPTSVILSSDFYTSASKTDNYSFQLFSDWTDTFSTEFKLGYQKFDNTNGAAKNQPEVYACFTAVAANCPNNPTSIPGSVDWVIAGEDRFRHENSIASKRLNGTLAGTWHLGDHVVKAGFDYLSNKTADVFGQLLHGSYGFYDKNGNGTPADEIAAGNYGTYVVNVLPDGVTLADSAGTWKYTQISPFLQDIWQATDRFSLVYGVRIDMPNSDHAPPVAVENAGISGVTAGAPVWQSRFGYPSNTKLGSRNSVVEPRVAFNYSFDTELKMQLHGGVGLFQSVPPTVWLSNPYVNNGVVGSKQYTNNSLGNPPFSPDPNHQPGPATVTAGVCGGSAGVCQIDTLDPNFKLPTSLKLNLAFDSELPWWGLVGSAEYLFIKASDAIAYIAPNIGRVTNGTLPDGRDSYWKTAGTSGTGANFGAYPEINTRSTELTNTSQGMSNSLTLALSKPWQNGLSGTVSATFTHSTDVNPGTSSQAYSNFNYNPRVNANEIVAANSRFNIPLSFKTALSWDHAFFGDNKTTASLFYTGHSGLPYSWTFGSDVNGDSLAFDDLAYIPLKNDPLVSYGSATQAQIDSFNAFIDNNSYLKSRRGQIATRNASNSPWVNQLDLGLQQELPGFFGNDKFIVRLDIYNFLNLLNKKWGDVENAGFFGTRNLVSSASVANGHYVYNLSRPPQAYTLYDTYTNPARVVSRWQMLLTLKYKF